MDLRHTYLLFNGLMALITSGRLQCTDVASSGCLLRCYSRVSREGIVSKTRSCAVSIRNCKPISCLPPEGCFLLQRTLRRVGIGTVTEGRKMRHSANRETGRPQSATKPTPPSPMFRSLPCTVSAGAPRTPYGARARTMALSERGNRA